MIKLNFLGTSDAIPTAKRNHSAILLTYEGENILIDCGEGTQRQFRKAKLNPGKVTRILITHWHADHVLGLMGLLKTLKLGERKKPVYIYGPKGTKKNMEKLFEAFGFKPSYLIEIKDVSGKVLETEEFLINSESMDHEIPCNAYSFVVKGQRRIDKKKLKKLKIPSIPSLKNLKQGKDISYNGKKYKSKNLTYKEEDKKISFVFDTRMNKKIIPFVKNSNLLISEASFGNELTDLAKEYGHLTSAQAGEITKKSKSKKLIVTHISQRYEKDLKQILKEAQKVFKNSFLVKDLDSIELE